VLFTVFLLESTKEFISAWQMSLAVLQSQEHHTIQHSTPKHAEAEILFNDPIENEAQVLFIISLLESPNKGVN